MAAGRNAGLRHVNTVVWNKGSGAMGTPYRSAHELVVVFAKGDKLAVNNVELGRHGRDRTNVWSYPGANRKGSSAAKALVHHPTPKPIEMIEDAIKDVTKRGAVVLDPFLGSGTTLLAAERSARTGRAIELDPGYVDVAIRRWEELTGRQAMHSGTGRSFTELAIEREKVGQALAA
jgi:DNA modification methylase